MKKKKHPLISPDWPLFTNYSILNIRIYLYLSDFIVHNHAHHCLSLNHYLFLILAFLSVCLSVCLNPINLKRLSDWDQIMEGVRLVEIEKLCLDEKWRIRQCKHKHHRFLEFLFWRLKKQYYKAKIVTYPIGSALEDNFMIK